MDVINSEESFIGDLMMLEAPNKTRPYFPLSNLNASASVTPTVAIFPNVTQFRETSNMTTRQRDEDLAKVEMGVLACIFVATLLGNAIVIFGIYFRRQKMTRMYYFILHLSFADLITAFFNVGAQFIMELTFPSFLGNNALCKFVKFTQILGPYSSSYVLVMTALDRYHAICFPLTNCTWTARQSKLMLGIAWFISLLFCIPQLFIFSLQEVMGFPDCWASFPPGGQEVYVTWYAISFFIVPLLILVFAYTCICRAIWANFNMKTAAASKQREGATPPSPPSAYIASPSINETDMEDSVFPQEPLSNHGPGTVDRAMHSNRLNNSKDVEVSWGTDKKGNVSSIRYTTVPEATGAGPPSRYKGKDSLPLISPKRDGGVEVEGHELNRTSSNVKSLNGFSGINGDSLQSKTSGEEFPISNDPKSKTKGIQSTRNYKWPSSKTKMASANGRLVKPNVNSIPTMVGIKDKGSKAESSGRKRLLTDVDEAQPRTSSVKGISRAKIKTVKLTVTVICCYIFCSSPFITAQLWVTFDPNAYQSKFYTGTTFTILTLLASLNSCVNPWIFLFFNPNLLQDFLRGIGCKLPFPMGAFRRRPSGSSPVTQKTSPGHLRVSFTARRFSNVHHISRNRTPSRGSLSRRDSPALPAAVHPPRHALSSATATNEPHHRDAATHLN